MSQAPATVILNLILDKDDDLISRTLAVLALPLAAAILAPTAGAQTGHFGGVQSAVGSGFSSPVSVAIDTRGDIFIADAANRRIVEEIASGGVYTQTVVAEGLPPQLTGLAVDSAGNLYFANQSVPSLQKLAYSNGAYASTPVTLAQDFLSSVGVAVDASGNVYVVDSRLREVVKLANLNGQYVEGPVVSSLLLPTGVAVDASGDLFIADEQQNAIVEVSL